MEGRKLLLELDRAAGSVVESSVARHHRRRLRKLGWSRAFEPDGDAIWAGGEPSPRPGNRLDVLVDGAEAFPAIADAIAGAREYVHLAGWHVAPGFALTRCEPMVVLGTLLAEMAERVDVRVLVWAGSPLPVFHPTRSEVADAVETLTRRTRIRCKPDPREHPIHCHHEKIVIVDGRLAFVGGIDITDQGGDRYDSSEHPSRRRLAWHDVSSRLQGPAVADVDRHFAMRWAEVTGERIDAADPPAEAGPSTVQVIRTVAEHVRRRAPRRVPHPRELPAGAALRAELRVPREPVPVVAGDRRRPERQATQPAERPVPAGASCCRRRPTTARTTRVGNWPRSPRPTPANAASSAPPYVRAPEAATTPSTCMRRWGSSMTAGSPSGRRT